MNKYWLLLVSFGAVADDFPDDPFGDVTAVEASPYQNDLSLLGYYQSNQVNQNNRFNPGLTQFSDSDQLGVIDWQLKAQWSPQLQARFRTALTWENNEFGDESDAKLLEGYINWTSENYAWTGQVGRVKTEWSNGYNWSLTNLLRPYRDRPYIDLDDPLQQQGWDMANISYGAGNWRTSFMIADLDSQRQYVTRFSYQGSNDYSLILHKIPGQAIDAAASFSALINDSATFRLEWSLQHEREQTLLVSNDNTYQKFLLGSAYTNEAGFNFRLEYLNSRHGFDSAQWRNITNNSESAYQQVIAGQATAPDYQYLGNALSSLQNGQLRQNYLYFMMTTATSENLWQYRQSVQLNADDNSQLHRLELLKSFNDNLTGRLQWEIFNGCETCEYGLNPNKNNLRLIVKWVF
jgi:hypothetical protein